MTTTQTNEKEAGASLGTRQIVALHLGKEVYGVDIAIINTVITPQEITAVPRTPKSIRGVMNLRGRIIPVIDLRTRFDLPPLEAEEAKASRIMIVDVEGISAGLIVDAVSEVITLDESEIEPPSSLIASKESEFITGVGRITAKSDRETAKDQLVLLLDVMKAICVNTKESERLKQLNRAA